MQFRETVCVALLSFIEQGSIAAGKDLTQQFMNCSESELQKFMEDLGCDRKQLPGDYARYCFVEPETTEGE